MCLKNKQSPASYLVAALLGGILFLVSGDREAHPLSDLLFSLGSGAMIVGLVRLLGNLKMFASLSWGTRSLKRIFQNRMRSGREETEDYAAYRNQPGRRADAVPLLIAAVVFILLSFACAKLI